MTPTLRARPAAVAAAAAALALLTPAAGWAHDRGLAPADAAVVTDWIGVGLDEIAAHSVNPPRASRALAMLSVAMNDAVRVPRPYRAAVVGGAATTVLTHLFPDRAAAFEARLSGERSRFAVVAGRAVGARVVAWSRTDGSDRPWTGAIPAGPGLWTPTPPAFAPPLEPNAGTWRPWNLRWGGQFRPGPPPAPGSAEYDAGVREVHEVGVALTDEQRRIASFWADGAGTVTPPGHWNRIAVELIAGSGMDAERAARVLVTLNTAQADAFIACWDAKFAYWAERPVTAIMRDIDPAWRPFIATPPFPAYTSGHATTSGAASAVLAAHFPDHADELASWAREAAVSRLYGGIHFTWDNAAGLELGGRVAEEALDRYSGGHRHRRGR